MPRGSSAAPGWFVKGINEVIEGLERVAAYLDASTIPTPLPTPPTSEPCSNAFERTIGNVTPPRPKLPPPKPTSWDIRCPPTALALTPTRRCLNKDADADKREANPSAPSRQWLPPQIRREPIHTPTPHRGPAQARSRIPFHPSHGSHDPPGPPRTRHLSDLGYPRLGRRDNSRPFRLYRDPSRDGFGTTLEQTNQTAPSAPSSLSVAPS